MVQIDRFTEILMYFPNTGIFRWKVHRSSRVRAGSIAGVVESNGYRRVKIDGHRYLAHRLAWFWMTGRWPERLLDHIDGDRDNNAFNNLRECSQSQNKANQGVTVKNKLGIKGVSYRSGLKKPYAVMLSGKRLGYFATPEEAHAAYLKAAVARYGQFARG